LTKDELGFDLESRFGMNIKKEACGVIDFFFFFKKNTIRERIIIWKLFSLERT
jgi:hypothetical protein